MNINPSVTCDSHKNISPSSRTDASQYQRAKQRRVLGDLSVNEPRCQAFSQGSQLSKHSVLSDSSQLTSTCPSSSSYVYVEEAHEVDLAASSQEVVLGSCCLYTEPAYVQNQDLKLLLELSPNASEQSEPDTSLMSEEAPCVSEYAEDIQRHMRESEMNFRPKPDYLRNHPEISSDMRVILVDWLVGVVQKFKLRKYEENFPPVLKDFVYITDNTYTNKQLVQMEHFFLRVLAFKMVAPTTHQFLCLFMSIHSVCANTENLAQYLAELSLLEMDPFLQYTPSILAAGAYCLASYTVNKYLWPDSLCAFTGYTMDEIVPCLTDLHKLYINAESRREQTIREKYQRSKHCRVSQLPPPPVLPLQ